MFKFTAFKCFEAGDAKSVIAIVDAASLAFAALPYRAIYLATPEVRVPSVVVIFNCASVSLAFATLLYRNLHSHTRGTCSECSCDFNVHLIVLL
jgi:hypothetical protein